MTTTSAVSIVPLEEGDRGWLVALLDEGWGGSLMVSRGRLHNCLALPGLLARLDEVRAGVLLYHIEGAACEVVLLQSVIEGQGVAAALIAAAAQAARAAGCERLWLVTTNDNTPALRFYQRRGFRLAALHPGAVDEARRLKPSIPLYGVDGIPIRDEIELEMALG
ncbi:MAG: GNAT family N-acetyltransferase [Anaerolineae bacterium]